MAGQFLLSSWVTFKRTPFSRAFWPGLLATSVAFSVLLDPFFAFVFSSYAAAPSKAMQAYQNGRELERQGKLEEAEQAFRQAMAFDPYDGLNYIKLAGVLTELGRTEEAIGIYKKAAEIDSQDMGIAFSLGNLYEQTGDYRQAEASYRRGLTKNPQYVYGAFLAARALAQSGQYPQAISEYRIFLNKYPKHAEARRYLANLLLATNQPQEAATLFQQLKNEAPQKFQDNVNLARALNQSNEPEKALDTLKEAYAADGAKAEIAEEMGNAHMALGQARFAINSYEKALALNPEQTDLSLRLAGLYRSEKNYPQAIGALKQYLKKSPDDIKARAFLGNVYLENKNFPEAQRTLSQVLEETPIADSQQRFEIGKQLGLSYQLNGQQAEAIQAYEGLLESPYARQDTDLKNNLAIAYHKSGALKKAAPLYREAYNAQKIKNPALAHDLTDVLLQLGDQALQAADNLNAYSYYMEASSYAAQNTSSDPLSLRRAQLGVANALQAREEFAQAYPLYEKVLALESNNREATLALARLDLRWKQDPLKALNRLQPLLPATGAVVTNTEIASGSGAQPAQGAGGQSASTGFVSNPPVEKASDVETRLLLAEAYTATGNYTEALSQLEIATRLDSTNTDLWLALGNAAQQVGKTEQALAAYQQAIALDNSRAMAHYNLATLYHAQEKWDQAKASYEEALRLSPTLSEAHFGLGAIEENRKRWKEALMHYDVYLKDKPQGTYAKDAQERMSILLKKNGVASQFHPVSSSGVTDNSIQPPGQRSPVSSGAPASPGLTESKQGITFPSTENENGLKSEISPEGTVPPVPGAPL